MRKLIKNFGLGISALALSVSAVVATPLVSSTYAADGDPSCAYDGDYTNCIYGTGAYAHDGSGNTGMYSVSVGGFAHLSLVSNEAADKISYRVADTSIANIVTEKIQSGNSSYDSTVLKGYKAGSTEIIYTLNSTKKDILSVPVEVYSLDFPSEDIPITIGSSHTFTVTPGANVEVTKVYLPSELFTEAATLKDNGDGSYTLTVNKMPHGVMGLGDGSEEGQDYPFIYVSIESKNKTTGKAYTGTDGVNFNIVDSIDEEEITPEMKNAAILEDSSRAIGKAVAADANIKDGDTVKLDDGSTFAVSNINALRAAVAAGKDIAVSLSEPTVIASVDKEVSEQMTAKLPAGTTGARYFDINVLVGAGNETFGKLTKVGSPLTVSVSVADESAIAKGYNRVYYAVRLHNGTAKRLDAVYSADDKTVSFESDLFSTYLLAYEDIAADTVTSPDSGYNTKSENGSASASYLGLIAIAGLAIAGYFVAKKRNA